MTALTDRRPATVAEVKADIAPLVDLIGLRGTIRAVHHAELTPRPTGPSCPRCTLPRSEAEGHWCLYRDASDTRHHEWLGWD